MSIQGQENERCALKRVEEKNSRVMEHVTLKKCVFPTCCLAGWLFLSVTPGLAQDPAGGVPVAAAQSEAPTTGEGVRLSSFVYQREGRSDPFLPFLSQEILKAGGKSGEEPMGLQKLETGQLTLVAIVFGVREAVAMVQDSAGMGYVIRKGAHIGRGGTVKDILPNRVLVEQVEQTPTSTVTRVVEMILKEGEKE